MKAIRNQILLVTWHSIKKPIQFGGPNLDFSTTFKLAMATSYNNIIKHERSVTRTATNEVAARAGWTLWKLLPGQG